MCFLFDFAFFLHNFQSINSMLLKAIVLFIILNTFIAFFVSSFIFSLFINSLSFILSIFSVNTSKLSKVFINLLNVDSNRVLSFIWSTKLVYKKIMLK